MQKEKTLVSQVLLGVAQRSLIVLSDIVKKRDV